MAEHSRLLFFLLLAGCAPQPEGWASRECSDGIDNDENGLTDCDDPECASNRDCLGFEPDSDTEDDSDTDLDTGTEADSDTEADTDPDTQPLDPIPDALNEDPPDYDPECNQRNGVSVAGALGWNLGRLTFTGNEVRGYTVWGLRANPTWEAGPGADCQITWSVLGVRGTAANCSACAYSLPMNLTLLQDESTCDPALIATLIGPRSVTYNVELTGTEAELYFPETGNRFATGTATDTTMNYRSPESCVFFSSR